MIVIICLILTFYSDSKMDTYVDYWEFQHSSMGLPMDSPGLIWRFYCDGSIIFRGDDGSLYRAFATKLDFIKIEEKTKKHFLKPTLKPLLQDTNPDSIRFFLINEGEPEFVYQHGVTFCLRSYGNTTQYYGFHYYVPKAGFIKDLNLEIDRIIQSSKEPIKIEDESFLEKDDTYPFATYLHFE